MTKFRKFEATLLFAAALFLLAAPALFAQKEIVKSRVTEAVDDLQTVRLRGNIHPLAKAQFDQGALPDSQPMERMLLLLQRSAGQETSLRGLLDAQQTKNSGSYHAWLTPDSFGTQFGPSDSDLQAVTDWLTRQGFQVSKVAAGRSVIEFSGTAGQVRKSFQTEIHRFMVNGEEHFANVSDPAIPQALTPVVAGVVALHNFPKTSHMHSKGIYRRVAGTSELKPLFTYGVPANFAMSPADFNTVYSIPTGATGLGQTIAVVGRSNINAQDIIDFRNLFGLPQNFTQAGNIIVNGPDPGILGPFSPGTGSDEGESDLDVEWAGAIAPNAKILFVTSQSTLTNVTQVTDGTDLSSLYVVDNNIASVMTDSYGSCEQGLTTAGNQFSNNLWEQAAAQGITVTVASGDTGSAACDPTPSSPDAAMIGLAVTGEASTPFNVAVGGTDFDPSTLPTTPPNQYWGATNSAQQGSALKYIPEVPWDNSLCAFNFPTACTSVDSAGSDIAAAGGGLSNCTVTDSNGNCTTSGYAKPSWQTNFSTATTRAIPDVSFFAANGGNGVAYIVCQADNLASGASCSLNSPFTDFGLAGGTSFSTPAFAGIMALVNERTGQRQGNANYVLYALAANDANYASGACGASVGATPAATCVYNDVTKGNISVACVAGTPNCSNTGSSGFGILVSSGNPAFTAVKGYDPATGLGSINVTNLLNKWASVTRTTTTTNLASLTGGTPSGTAFSVTVNVVPASAAGDVSLIALASDGTTALGSFGPFTLAGGTALVTTPYLPASTAFVEASYGGDATHSLSTSAPVALAVQDANQVSKVTLNFVSMDNLGNITGITTGAQKLPYGSEFYILNIVVTGTLSSGQPCGFGYPNIKAPLPCPTGKITMTDNGTALNDFPNGPLPNATNMAKLNNLGLAEDQPVNLPVGVHSVVATYAGDPNYQGSPSNALSITFTQAATTTAVQSNLGTVPSGGSVTIIATVNTNSNGVGPTGTVQFANGTSNIGAAVTCVPTSATASTSGTAFCTATVTTTLSALPPVLPVNRRAPPMPVLPITLLAFAMILYLAYVQRMQQGQRRNFAYAGLLIFALLVAGVSGCGGGSSSGGGHTVTINASYAGDTNYTASSGSTTVVVQ
jgi:Pro-kumamolisin, activation domain/Bacterial Ig-like domain (group 3)